VTPGVVELRRSMKIKHRSIIAIILATAWVAVSEFTRNELVFKSYWVDHYAAMGLDFPDALVNGAIWGVWSLVFAALLWVVSRRFSAVATMVIGWVAGFVLMWLVIGNLAVLPFSLLWFAVPLSILEAVVAVIIVRRVDPPEAGV
jgi:hypothetical protein